MELVLATPSGQPVFCSPKGGFLRSSNFTKKVFRPALERAGLPKTTIYELRNKPIILQIEGATDSVSASKIAGRSSPANTLRIYAHEIDRYRENIREALNRGMEISRFDRFRPSVSLRLDIGTNHAQNLWALSGSNRRPTD